MKFIPLKKEENPMTFGELERGDVFRTCDGDDAIYMKVSVDNGYRAVFLYSEHLVGDAPNCSNHTEVRRVNVHLVEVADET